MGASPVIMSQVTHFLCKPPGPRRVRVTGADWPGLCPVQSVRAQLGEAPPLTLQQPIGLGDETSGKIRP